ncbi:MAG TPA: S8 family peptidase [Longimicrobium sp.]|nr:S8 family peptidase [Longimicrobium sp.]
MTRSFLLLPLLALAAACAQDATAPVQRSRTAPVLSRSADGSGQYIVVLNRGADARSVAAVAGVKPKYVYEAALDGFAATLNQGQLNALQHNPHVAFIEADGVMQTTTTLLNATWGLDRIDQQSLPLSTTFTYLNTGAGVNAYVIDTGLRFTHVEVAGRATSGYDAVDGGTADDCNGHGTHTAGTVGGLTYGVAKAVNLVAVRVLGCNGSGATSGVIAGVDWVTANHVKPAVVNMSLGGGANAALDSAVKRSIANGVTYAIAAGNGNIFGFAQNACNVSPSRVPEAITVSATDKTDKKASYANYGSCVDLFAPGVAITSAWYTSNTATSTIGGTSMASPHVAGVAAQYLQSNPTATPAQVAAALIANATTGKVTSAGTGSPNRLLFTAY